jgi:hypothetical protein
MEVEVEAVQKKQVSKGDHPFDGGSSAKSVLHLLALALC